MHWYGTVVWSLLDTLDVWGAVLSFISTPIDICNEHRSSTVQSIALYQASVIVNNHDCLITQAWLTISRMYSCSDIYESFFWYFLLYFYSFLFLSFSPLIFAKSFLLQERFSSHILMGVRANRVIVIVTIFLYFMRHPLILLKFSICTKCCLRPSLPTFNGAWKSQLWMVYVRSFPLYLSLFSFHLFLLRSTSCCVAVVLRPLDKEVRSVTNKNF